MKNEILKDIEETNSRRPIIFFFFFQGGNLMLKLRGVFKCYKPEKVAGILF